MFNEKTCTIKWWNAEEPFVEKRLALLQKIEKESEKDTPESTTNEASEYTCDYCGCDHCGEPLLLRECGRCGSTLCGCHVLPEEHDCVAVPIKRGWSEYAKWQEKLR